MRNPQLRSIGFLALASGCCGWKHASRNEFQTAVGTTNVALVAFVMPSQAKTRALETEWLSVINDVKDTLLSIDCGAEPVLCDEHGVGNYPTLQLFQGGQASTKYLGPRRASGITNFISRFKRPSMTEVEAGTLDDFKAIDETVFLGHFSPDEEVARKAFYEMAEQYREEFTFGIVSDSSKQTPSIDCHVDGETRTFTSFFEPEALTGFILEASRRVIGELMPYNQQRLLDRGWPMVYLFAATEEGRAELRSSLYKFAKNYYESITCVTVDPLEFPELQAKLGLEPGVFPSGAIHQLSKDRIYPYPRGSPVTSQALQKFGLDVWQGHIKPWTASGHTTTYTDLEPTRMATRRVSLANIPGVNIRVAGHDEL